MRFSAFVLGGYQSDFAQRWGDRDGGIATLFEELVAGALDDARVDATEVEVGHVGNFAGERYLEQGHLGGLLPESHPDLAGLPATRHEGACASGSLAVLAAAADIEAGRYDVAIVVGAEVMKTMPSFEAQQQLACAAWVPRETDGVDYPWPHLFNELASEYADRYGLDHRHLEAIARKNRDNASRNPNAQARAWSNEPDQFGADDDRNPTVVGHLRRQDCGPLTDGGAALVLASPRFAAEWARRTGRPPDGLARITGWGHRTSRMTATDMVRASRDTPYLVPQLPVATADALRRAGVESIREVDFVEGHDCFSFTELLLVDHIGIVEPGTAATAVEDGLCEFDGPIPFNPSGGLLGVGHPVGASGARMVLDAHRQVTGTAGDYQVPGASRGLVVNLGGSATTIVTLVVERG